MSILLSRLLGKKRTQYNLVIELNWVSESFCCILIATRVLSKRYNICECCKMFRTNSLILTYYDNSTIHSQINGTKSTYKIRLNMKNSKWNANSSRITISRFIRDS